MHSHVYTTLDLSHWKFVVKYIPRLQLRIYLTTNFLWLRSPVVNTPGGYGIYIKYEPLRSGSDNYLNSFWLSWVLGFITFCWLIYNIIMIMTSACGQVGTWCNLIIMYAGYIHTVHILAVNPAQAWLLGTRLARLYSDFMTACCILFCGEL